MIRINIRKKLNLTGGASELVVDTEMAAENITALYGKSGAGKTSLLKIIAGLMQPETGFIEVNGQVWLDTSKKINLPPQKRNLGFVFQDYALFPNMTVKQNLLYASGNKPDHTLIDHLLTLTGLTTFSDHRPATLSGGQKQRVALARALVRKPKLLLLDEPLAAVDAEARTQLQQELQTLRQEYHFTALLVSHDTAEISTLASSVICLNDGIITKAGTPAEVFGGKNAGMQGRVIAIDGQNMQVAFNGQLLNYPYLAGLKPGDKVNITVQPSAK